MDNLIPNLYREYGLYVNRNRALPLDLDGLKPVERRVLLSTFEIARGKLVKSARVDGHVIGHYHPHGSCYTTIIQMVNNGFLDKQGNFGSSVGVEPCEASAMRYTECKLSNWVVEMAFKYIDYVPKIDSELDKEPLFIPTMFPFCLMGSSMGIGFGCRILSPTFELSDLFKRLEFLLGKIKKEPIIKPKTDCVILSKDDELKELLEKGTKSIKVRGKYTVDKKNNRIILNSWPEGNKFKSIISKFSKEFENNDIGIIDLSRKETNIIFEVSKLRNRDEIFKSFLEKFEEAVIGNINYEITVVDVNGKVYRPSVDELLLKSYKEFIDVNKVMLNTEINRINTVINEYKILEKIRPFLGNYLSKNKIKDIEEIIKNISKESEESEEIIKELFNKYRINRLLTINIDINDLSNTIKYYKDKLEKIEEHCLDQYSNFISNFIKRRKS